jgi:small subunit ribosomal protein S20
MELPRRELTNPDKTHRIRGSLYRHQIIRSHSLANTSQAKKRARQAETRRQRNVGQRSEVRTAIKHTVIAAQAGDKGRAAESLKAATPIIDSMARKGIISKNKAARHKSRLNQRVRALAAT